MGTNHIIVDTNLNETSQIDNFEWKYQINNGEIIIETNSPDTDIIKIINSITSKGITINKIKTKESTLEEIFIKVTNEKK